MQFITHVLSFYIKLSALIAFLGLSTFGSAFEIDFSRREADRERMNPVNQSQLVAPQAMAFREPASDSALSENSVSFPISKAHEIVIVNTDKGFVPSQVHLHKGQGYKFYVFNLNKKFKNNSFIIDQMKVQHATFFGEAVMFQLKPEASGVFSFESPEASVQGKIVVVDRMESERKPASDNRK